MPETAHKDGVSIKYKTLWKTMELTYHMNENLSNLEGGELSKEHVEVTSLGETINNNEDNRTPIVDGRLVMKSKVVFSRAQAHTA